ncbi:hypothetical protein MMC07_005594 [Pseudocyphellaria aurata]|nr:hypothetical protein [Pseudocyphellaria aurata]
MVLAHPGQLRQHSLYGYIYEHDDQSFSSPSPSPPPTLNASDCDTAVSQSTVHSPYFDLWSGSDSDANHSAAAAFADSYSSGNRDVHFMASPAPHNLPIRLQRSTPDADGSRFTSSTSSPMPEESTQISSAWWDQTGDGKHLSPQTGRPHRRGQDRLGGLKRLSWSSAGSAGPDSPHNQTYSHPRIVDGDYSIHSSPQVDSFDHSVLSAGGYPSKAMFPSEPSFQNNLFAPAFQKYDPSKSSEGDLAAVNAAMKQALAKEQGSEMRQEEPMTALASFHSPYDFLDDERTRLSPDVRSNIPSLDRAMPHAYADELFDTPSAPPPSSAREHNHHNPPSPFKTTFNGRLQAQLNRGSRRSDSPVTSISRECSPFRQAQGFASERYSNAASSVPSPATRLEGSAPLMREPQREVSAGDYQRSNLHRDLGPSSTISPMDAVLDYDETEDAAKMPLFPQENLQKRENQFASRNSNTRHLSRSDADSSNHPQRNYGNHQTSRRQNSSNLSSSSTPTPAASIIPFMPPSLPGNVQMPQQYPFISNSRRQSSSLRSASDPEFPPQLSSMESTKSENSQPDPVRFTADADATTHSPSSPGLQRPADTMAASGSYTCTAAGCSQRFDTAPKLQKHRRDAHGPTSPQQTPVTPTLSSGSAASAPGSSTSATATPNRNSQAGPHKCERVNPSTNKPCNTVFSRSYDLTRHEDTIHNNRKQKVRCHLCTEEKTFSRNDALTRHMRVVHPDVDFPGKNKRRGG